MRKALAFTLAVLLALSLPFTALAAFSDVPGGIWFEDAVRYATDEGYMNGTGGGRFDPAGMVSRAQMAQILYNFSKSPDVSGLSNPFWDVGDKWYKDGILFAKHTGIVSGTSETAYSPNRPITREQVAVMLMGYYKAAGGRVEADQSALAGYEDATSVSTWAREAVAWAVRNNVMAGSGSRLNPKSTCIRAELAQFIKNYCDKLGKPGVVGIKPAGTLPQVYGYDPAKVKPIDPSWLPEGGYWKDGRKYNKYDIDITDVDGVPDETEIRLMALINEYRVENGLQELKWNQHAQLLSEVRVREANWIEDNKISEYGGPHVRPDRSSYNATTLPDGTTKNELMIDELINDATFGQSHNKLSENIIDPEIASTGLSINKTSLKIKRVIYENAGWFYTINDPIEDATEGLQNWQKSPGHDATLKADMSNRGKYQYFAVGIYTNNNGRMYRVYNAYALDWHVPDVTVDPSTEWHPGKDIDYKVLGFKVTDIPLEYTDWIERELEMTPEQYGPADHDEQAVRWWIRDHDVAEYSTTLKAVLAHFYSAQTQDDFIKYMISRTPAMHYTFLRPGGLHDINGLSAGDIMTIKNTVVEYLADWMACGHPLDPDDKSVCSVCGKDHTEKRSGKLNEAKAAVNNFFMDNYGFDISGYGY